MKKLLSLLLVALLASSLFACGDNSGDPAVSTPGETEQTGNGQNETVYNNKTYIIGDDIPEGTYVINCTKSSYGMDAVVFQSETDYAAFQKADQFTTGEYKAAVEKHAWASFYIKEGESVYVALKSGNVILLDDGMCEFSKHDVSGSNMLYSGIYVVGADISAGALDIKCTTNALRVVVFETAEKYAAYHKASRFTVGEESDAIKANSLSNAYITKDKSTSIRLKQGMILMIDDGTGEYSADEGPVIN